MKNETIPMKNLNKEIIQEEIDAILDFAFGVDRNRKNATGLLWEVFKQALNKKDEELVKMCEGMKKPTKEIKEYSLKGFIKVLNDKNYQKKLNKRVLNLFIHEIHNQALQDIINKIKGGKGE